MVPARCMLSGSFCRASEWAHLPNFKLSRRERHPRGCVGHCRVCRQRPRLLLVRHLLRQLCGTVRLAGVNGTQRSTPWCNCCCARALVLRLAGHLLGQLRGAMRPVSQTQCRSHRNAGEAGVLPGSGGAPDCPIEQPSPPSLPPTPPRSASHLNKSAWNYGAIPIIFLFM